LIAAADLRRWLSSGALQSSSGAYCAWLDEDAGTLAFEYPEITGYALTWLAGRPDPTARELAAGARAARWLVHRLSRGDRSARPGWDREAVYTFDLGMIAAGLISFGRLVGDGAAVDVGLATARELAAYVAEAGYVPAVAPDGPATSRAAEWSTVGCAHGAKCVQALLLADEVEAAATLVAVAARCQRGDGAVRTQPEESLVMLHPHLYTVEALWMWGTARGDDDALDRARRATDWAWRQQLSSGGLPRCVGSPDAGRPAVEQCDVTAQAIRAALLTGADPHGLEQAVYRLGQIARPAGRGARAALVYQPESGQRHLNAWVTMFGAQALELAESGRGSIAWTQLV
jgi:hypothetical protein